MLKAYCAFNEANEISICMYICMYVYELICWSIMNIVTLMYYLFILLKNLLLILLHVTLNMVMLFIL